MRVRLAATVASLPLLLVTLLVAMASPASAQTVLCSAVSQAEVAACDQNDWADNMQNSYWSMYAGHNCTNYVAYRMTLNGVPTPTKRLSNANLWATNAGSLGYKVDTTPAVGAAGVFGSVNHVVYIDAVGDGFLMISEDNYPGYFPKGMYRRIKVYPGDSLYPKQFIHFEARATNLNPINNGDVVSYHSRYYRIVGGAPVYVPDLSALGNVTVKQANDSQWATFAKVPADGTLLTTVQTGQLWVVAGGTALPVSSWDALAAQNPVAFGVDQAAIANAGGTGVWAHLAAAPPDGTFLRGGVSGRVFKVVGGAPLYVSDLSRIGGASSIVTVDDAFLDAAGTNNANRQLRAVPADGTFVRGYPSKNVYVIAGGAPMQISSWKSIGLTTAPATISVDDDAITGAGSDVTHSHLKALAGNVFLRGGTSKNVFRVADNGAAWKIKSWVPYGGKQATITVDDSGISKCSRISCSPFGSLDVANPLRGRVDVSGWATDPSTSKSISVKLKVDGVGAGAKVLAAGARPDVYATYKRGKSSGFASTIRAVSAGAHQVCAVGINVGKGSSTTLGCTTVTVLPKLTSTVTARAVSRGKGSMRVRVRVAVEDGSNAQGTVTITRRGKVIAANVALVNGTVLIPVKKLASGTRAYRVSYSGNDDVNGSAVVVKATIR